jgi:phosphoenolpyruvate-protein phosphotransferase (PTS system enzyme I)
MFPMISSLEELLQAKEFLERAKEGVVNAGYAIGNLQIGMMIEIPSAALIAARLAPEVDFFSIGTNDLTQYTVAVDRENYELGDLYQPYHPAVLGLIAHVARAAREAGIWTGVCGEAAGDCLLAPFFACLGIKELSMAPGLLPKIRQQLAALNWSDTAKEDFVAEILACATSAAVIKVLKNK